VHATSGTAQIKFFKKAISSTYDENSTYWKNRKTHHRNYSILMKKTRQIMTATLVQNSAARWHSICQNLSTQTIKKTKREKSNNNKKTPHTPTLQKKT
jgi:hypothetical protein